MTRLEKVLITYAEFPQIGIQFSRKHINWLMARGRFPKPIRLGGNDMSTKAYWRVADIYAWIEERATASGLPPIGSPAGLAATRLDAALPK
jgi:predicted DNA-binding transcriptional regulator AlpA